MTVIEPHIITLNCKKCNGLYEHVWLYHYQLIQTYLGFEVNSELSQHLLFYMYSVLLFYKSFDFCEQDIAPAMYQKLS